VDVVIIIGREFTIMGLRNIATAEGFNIAASTLGKTRWYCRCVRLRFYSGSPPSLVKAAGADAALAGCDQCAGFRRAVFLKFWSQLDDRIKLRRKLSLTETRKNSQDPCLSDADRKTILDLAAPAITEAVCQGRLIHPIPIAVFWNAGSVVFVSLHVKGKLRGCIVGN